MGERAANMANALSNTIGVFAQISANRDERELEEIRDRRRAILNAELNKQNFDMERKARNEDDEARYTRAKADQEESYKRSRTDKLTDEEATRKYQTEQTEAARKFAAEQAELGRQNAITVAETRKGEERDAQKNNKITETVRKYGEKLQKIGSDYAVTDKVVSYQASFSNELAALKAGKASGEEVNAVATTTLDAMNAANPEAKKENLAFVKKTLGDYGYEVGPKPAQPGQSAQAGTPPVLAQGTADTVQQTANDLFSTQPTQPAQPQEQTANDEEKYMGQIGLKFLESGGNDLTPAEKATVDMMRLRSVTELVSRFGYTREQAIQLKKVK